MEKRKREEGGEKGKERAACLHECNYGSGGKERRMGLDEKRDDKSNSRQKIS